MRLVLERAVTLGLKDLRWRTALIVAKGKGYAGIMEMLRGRGAE